MKKEMIICIIIVALIIITNIIAQGYTKSCVESMTEKLNELEGDILLIKETSNDGTGNSKSILSSNNDTNSSDTELAQQLHSIDKTWHEFHNKLAFYIEHDELEKVETRISNLKGLGKSQKYEEMFPQIEECVFLLEHIRDKHTLTAINIF